ncbi:MAG: fused MFS/spermidine synthase, partial [Candidatus Omnitrophica bacterium]|nr:fused MFS/spermidine synthase [Candidatus Omnitrophota bacterium]
MTALYSLTLFVSAWLLFSIQPMIAKQILPDLGGAPIVWSACLVFFQTTLLGGYCYAHFVTERLGPRRQILMHLVLLALPLLLFIGLTSSIEGSLDASILLRDWLNRGVHPIIGLLAALSIAIGIPFFMLSSNAPLMQRWYSWIRSAPQEDPYSLYAASNLGSLIALLGYPLLERFLTLPQQTWFWRMGYLALFVLASSCALKVWQHSAIANSIGLREDQPKRKDVAGSGTLESSRQLRWLALAAAPSSLLVSVTNYITTDIAAAPLVWVIPLALYLLTFILVFGHRQWVPHHLVIRYFPMVLILWAITVLIGATEPVSVLIGVHLATFFVASLACHGELFKDRPAPERLTRFYLFLSLGGVLGSVLTVLVAPMIFNGFFEYPLILIVAFFVSNFSINSNKDADERGGPFRQLYPDIAIALAAGAFVITAAFLLDSSGYSSSRSLQDTGVRYLRGAVFAFPLIVLGIWSTRPVRFSLGLAAILLGAHLSSVSGHLIYSERTWYGVHRVTWDADRRFHQLVHGNTVHGREQWPPVKESPPGAYYHPTGPIGDVFALQQQRGNFHKVGVAGLGAGCLAYYSRNVSDRHWTFFEIDPEVARIAGDPSLFTFLSDAFPNDSRMDIVIGDARLKLAKAEDSSFDLIVLDAFSSDSVPIHLLTQEALEIYLSKLTEGGLLVFHISN